MILNDISFGFNGVPVVKNITGRFLSDGLTAVIGANGAGKSTLLKGLAGLIPPLRGSMTGATHVNYLPQTNDIHDDLPLTLNDFIAMSVLVHLKFYERLSKTHSEKIMSALKQMKLQDMARAPFNSLSGGQKQRAIFARAMLDDSKIMLLDEPFSALDFMTIEICMQILKRKASQGTAVVAVLHDYELVRRYFKETLILGKEPIAWGETKAVLTPDNLHKAHHIKENAA